MKVIFSLQYESKNNIAFFFLNTNYPNKKRRQSLTVTWQSFNLLYYLALPGCRTFVKSAQMTDIFTSDNVEQSRQLIESSSKPTTRLQRGDDIQPLKSKHTDSQQWTLGDVTLRFPNSFIGVIHRSSLLRSGKTG